MFTCVPFISSLKYVNNKYKGERRSLVEEGEVKIFGYII